MSRLLDPKILLAIKDLRLAARTAVSGLMAGINPSTIRGEGLEFSQYRSYQPGDDLRQLDWKVFARTDRYYIRDSEIETGIATRFVVDASASMNHEDNGYSKMEYARYLAASLGWLANLQGDAVGLYLLEAGRVVAMEPKRDYSHMARFWYSLEQVKAAGRISSPEVYKRFLAGASGRELVVFITDLYEQDEELMRILDNLSLMKHEILVFHIMGNNELEFDFSGVATLQDWETGRKININAKVDGNGYRERITEYLSEVRVRMLNRHFFYRLLNMKQPIDQALRDFLKQRAKLSV